jgi:hypothetical protein
VPEFPVWGHLKIMKPLTFVYVCRPGENEELRYSIRSVLHFFPNAEIWVIGQKPDWYCGSYMGLKEYPKSKHHSVYQNLKLIASAEHLPDEIIIMNDDFFFVKKIDKIQHYCSGRLINKVLMYEKMFPKSSYTKRLRKAYEYLKKNGIQNPIDYELHVPMKVSRSKLAESLKHSIPWRSAYGNLFKVPGIRIRDVKTYSKGSSEVGGYNYKSEKYPFLSTDEQSFNEIKDYLSKKFPNPTWVEADFL